MAANGENGVVPHVLIFPLPIQSPVNSMLKLAEILCLQGVAVTFLITEHNHQRLRRGSGSNVESRFGKYPGGFRFEVISDGLPEDHPRSVEQFGDMINSLQTVAEPFLRETLLTSEWGRTVTCAIVEGMFHYVLEMGKEIGFPVFAFETISPCCLWVYLCIPQLIKAGELPFRGEDLDRIVSGVPGMEGLLRVRDLPHFCRAEDLLTSKSYELIMPGVHSLPKAHGLILNSFQDLDVPIISLIHNYGLKPYMIGPLQQHLKAKLAERETTLPNSTNSFWEEDKNCIKWLQAQPEESVIYVSFGSLIILTRAQILEFWHGLVNSGVRFLWVVRPNMLKGEEDQNLVTKLKEGCANNGHIVSWAPQEEVLGHPAIGGFLTHSGWNSTLESIIAGKPMICWAQYVDQLVTSRLVSEVWKIGLDMKDECDRLTVEKLVKELMGSRRQEFKKSAQKLSKLASESFNRGGSSHTSLGHLINEIRRLSSIKHNKNFSS